MVLTAYFVLSPVIGLSCHRRLARLLARLDASVGASGPHDFAVRSRRCSSPAPPARGAQGPPASPARSRRCSSPAPPASIASRPALMTLRNAPRVGQDGGSCRSDLPDGLSEIFFQMGLDRKMTT